MKINRYQQIYHDSGKGHVTGESEFIDDRLLQPREVLVGIIPAPVAHGRIKKLEVGQAKQIEGFVGFFTAKDFHHPYWGPVREDQPLLVTDEFCHHGEPLAIVAAENEEALKEIKRLIEVDVEPLPAFLSIDEARKKGSFFEIPPQRICTGHADEALLQSPHRLKGVFNNEGQEHFYLESQAAIAYPGENQTVEILSSTQHPTEVQHVVAHALGLKFHQVVVSIKRMGGGFGGKESQASHYAALAALVALKTKRPARIILSKDEDMMITGKRHPFQTDYEVGFDDEGKIHALKVQFYADGGAYLDLSLAILSRALFHVDNAYYIPHAYIEGHICRTHLASNTAFRGFGAPQGIAVIENIIEEMAVLLKKDPADIRYLNFYSDKTGHTTPYGQPVENNMLEDLYQKIMRDSHYRERREAILKENLSNKVKLKGISFLPVKFGISFTATFLNQGSALINIHKDGTIQVSTGATEMGQGVNTKILSVVAECFDIDPENVRIMITSTEKNHNTSATAASSGADINCSAALKASQNLKYRLSKAALMYWKIIPEQSENIDQLEIDVSQVLFSEGEVIYLPSDQKVSFVELLNWAHMHRISLGEQAFYRTPHIFYDPTTGKGHPFLYYTQGAAVTEIVIDRFTGELKVTSADLLMDLGRPLNIGIDQGQIAGAYIQCMGWVTSEELYYKEGKLISHSPTTYKIPNVQDTPRHFNIQLIENENNLVNVRGSKAVGEPPFVLGLSVWTAIKSALHSIGKESIIPLKIPATQELILKNLTALQKDFLI